MGSTNRLSLSVQYACGEQNIPSRGQVRRWVAASAERAMGITIRFVASAEARTLNRDFRNKDYPTNVLTFVYDDKDLQGDIAICVDVIKKEAKEQKKMVHAHFAHMVIHGVLHLQGYEHETKKDAAVMESREIELLRRFRITNPYE